jgi:HD-GYP domain-containing protein (c-di-GMP phosphodiesterase class II)
MSDTQVLLNQIIALRQRLDQVQGLMSKPGPTGPVAASPNSGIESLQWKVAAGNEHQALLDSSFRRLARPSDSDHLPTQLTARARKVLVRGREQLERLRDLAKEFDFDAGAGKETAGVDALPADAGIEPLTAWYRETVSMTEAALRLMGAMPDAPSFQLRLCQGVEPVLETVAQRIEELTEAANVRRQETARVTTLAELLTSLESGQLLDIAPFQTLAEAILGEAEESPAIRFLNAEPTQPAQFIACHSLLVAQVAAQVMRHAPDWQRRPERPLLAALVHDVGMLRVPVEVLTKAETLTDEERRAIEAHAHVGSELAKRLVPDESWLAEVTADHHERLDGTGYPGGLKDTQIGSLTRLISVCDVYAALCSPRPHRAAKDTRTALTDTLLLAERGALDRYHAERLMTLSFYPVGCAVELADGALGIVVATPSPRGDLQAPARPVVAVLTDSEGRPLATPHHIDLGRCEGHSIVRSLPASERRARLGSRHPLLAA